MLGFLFQRKKAGILAAALCICALVSGCNSSKPNGGNTGVPVTPPAIGSPAETENPNTGASDTVLDWSSPEQLHEALDQGQRVPVAGGMVELVSYTGFDEMYAAQNLSDGLFGVYDLGTEAFLSEPIYGCLGPYREGLALASYQGYYGYVDERGEKVIGFMYDEGTDFLKEGIALVKTAGWYGVINRQGDVLVETVYTGLKVDRTNQIISAYTQGGTVELFFVDGRKCVNEKCYGYEVHNGLLYASKGKEGYLVGQDEWYSLYDLNGNKLIGEGTDLPEIVAVTLPVNGACIAYGTGTRLNAHNANYQEWFQYLDENARPLSDNIYIRPGVFNETGYAVAGYTRKIDSWSYVNDWAVLNLDGTEVYCFLDMWQWWEISPWRANAYFACGYVPNQKTAGREDSFILISRETQERTGFPFEPQFVANTNCIIVKNSSGFYGLYDGSKLVYDCIYNDLYYDGSNIVGRRGAETSSYTPTA